MRCLSAPHPELPVSVVTIPLRAGLALQMATGTLRAAGKTTLTVMVSGQERQLPGVIAKGRILTDKEAHDLELVFLDDLANPLMLSSRIGTERMQLLSINYPVDI